MEAILEFLRTSEVFSLFLIIALGFMLGNIRVRGFSLDVSAVIFVALLFGHYGITVPHIVQSIGLVLFIFTVGIQAGPGFVDAFHERGRKYVMVAALLVVVGMLTSVLFLYVADVPSDMMAGLICGALTSTPGLSVAIESTGSPLASIGYGIAYPVGVVGVILFVKLLPKFMGVDPRREYEKIVAQRSLAHPEILHGDFRVEHEQLFGKTLAQIAIRAMTGCTVSRIQRDGHIVPPAHDTELQEGDIVRAVGTKQSLEQFRLLVGSPATMAEELDEGYGVRTLLVTNKELVNVPMVKALVQHGLHVTVTRIRRSGIDFSPSPQSSLKFGDKITVVGSNTDLQAVTQLFGNSAKALSDTDLLPVALGVVLGILFGFVMLSFGQSLAMNLGVTGGVLIVALVLSNIGKTGPILWTMSGAANNLLRQLGLLFFLAGVGTTAGKDLVSTIATSGLSLLFIGAAVTFLPMVVTWLLNRFFFKLTLFELLGVLTGGMTSTPGLAACDSMSYDETPSMVYATVYPVAMITLLIAVKIIALL